MAQNYASDRRGSAAAEFAIWATALAVPIVSAIDLGFYAYLDMQLNNAAQAAAQAAWAQCSASTLLPAAKNCTGLQTALATAAHSTGLGTSAVLETSSEGYYCMNTSGVLTLVGTAGSIPATGAETPPTVTSGTCASLNATSFAGNTQNPGDYVLITVQYTYKPIFKGLSVLSILSPGNTTSITMTRTAWMRLA